MLPVFIFTTLVLAAAGARLNPYIINGEEVEAGVIRYQVYLTTSTGGFRCSGVLYNANKVLTAATCTSGAVSVVCGVSNRPAGGGQTRSISSIVQHPGYDSSVSSGYANNLAMVTVSTSFTFNENCSTATLPDDNGNDFAYQTAQISGWGFHDDTNQKSEKLRRGNVAVLTNAACSALWGTTSSNPAIGPGHLCVQGSIAACTGDSGGPVTVAGKVVGVISFGQANCGTTLPEVATRLPYYLDWIKGQATSR